LLGTTAEMYAVTYEPLPNRPHVRSFYYYLDMADYPQLLLPNTSPEVMQGYILADSVVKAMPSITYLWNPIEELNLLSDTVQYIYKYWYSINNCDPLRFYAFRNRKYPEAHNNPSRLQSEMRGKMYVDPKFTYVGPHIVCIFM
jgi:hypothetical protein